MGRVWDAEGLRVPVSPLRETGSERVQGSAGGSPPAPARVARAGAGHNGPAGRADRPRPGCRKGKRNGERAEGEGGPGGLAVDGAGGEAPRRGSPLPHRRANKDARGIPAEPCPAAWGERRRRWQVRSSEQPGGAIMGGVPDPPHAGKSPVPAAARARPRGPRSPQRRRRRRRRRWKVQGAERRGRGRGRGESWVRVCFVLPGWLRARPRGRTSGRASVVPRPRSGRPGAAPRRAALAGSLPEPRPGLSRSASPSSSRPPARSRSLD